MVNKRTASIMGLTFFSDATYKKKCDRLKSDTAKNGSG